MYVYLNTNLFSEQQYFRDLDRIIHFFEDGKHKWIVESDEDIDAILDSEWLNSQGDRVRPITAEFIERAYRDLIHTSINERKNRRTIQVNRNDNQHVISIKFAIDYLNEPLYILVENEFSDSTFLNALFRCFRKKGKKIRKAITHNWLQYYNAGGKTMINKIIEDRVKRIPLPIRLFVFTDSDKNSPEHNPKSTQSIVDLCNTNQIPFHILYKREIENYLPEEALLKVPNQLHQLTHTLFALDPMLQDFYDLEKGFRKHKNPIFDNISNEQRNTLKPGYDQHGYEPKKELHLLFNDESINRKSLNAKCKHQNKPDELYNILEKITNLL